MSNESVINNIHSKLLLDCPMEYAWIRDYYGDSKAKRSGVLKINHIIEGAAILYHIGACNNAIRAYCLHPFFQEDELLYKIYDSFVDLKYINKTVIILAMEYRYIANSYLSTKNISSLDEIKLSPISCVNNMLIADKVQNKKDCDLYNRNIENYNSLNIYFNNWLKKLNVNYDELRSIICL